MKRVLAAVLSLAIAEAAPVWAGEADVVGVEIAGANGVYRFDVTVRHGDTGWAHYALSLIHI